ncbi:MAG TPA: sulfurtransferase TusA family protein [Terriglobales bacterium]|nr:sulfurtransferase TusA family protein [Terriglobales bacterium]
MHQVLDLRGVKCPLNWARAKVHLEQLRRGQQLELLIDDPKGARDIPRAAEAEGWSVTRMVQKDDTWHMVIAV